MKKYIQVFDERILHIDVYLVYLRRRKSKYHQIYAESFNFNLIASIFLRESLNFPGRHAQGSP